MTLHGVKRTTILAALLVSAGAAASQTSLAVTAGVGGSGRAVAGRPVTLTATVFSSGAPVTSGFVEFCGTGDAFGCDELGSEPLTADGTASLTFMPLPGCHSYVANSPDGSVSAPAAIILPLSATTQASVQISTPDFEGNFQPSAEVTVVTAPNVPPPSGKFTLMDADSGETLGTFPMIAQSGGVSWSLCQAVPVGPTPRALAAADFNGDGHPDLAVANFDGASVSVLLGNGDGTFRPGPLLATTAFPTFLVAGDFSGHGATDLAVASSDPASPSVTVFLSNGDGSFTRAQTLSLPFAPAGVTMGHFAGTAVDLAVVAGTTRGVVTVFGGDGRGNFQPGVTTLLAAGKPVGIVATDSGVAVLNALSTGQVTMLLNAGGGTFTPGAILGLGDVPIGLYQPNGIAAGDFQGRHLQDFMVLDAILGQVRTFSSVGDGRYAAGFTDIVESGASSLAIGDFNGDGFSDYAVADSQRNLAEVAVNRSGPGGNVGAALRTGAGPAALAVGDFDGDGQLDLAAANAVDGTVSIFLAQSVLTGGANFPPMYPPVGKTRTLQALYSGDATYAATASQIAVQEPIPTLAVTVLQETVSVADGNISPPTAVQVSSVNEYNGTANLNCAVVLGIDCFITPEGTTFHRASAFLPVSPGAPAVFQVFLVAQAQQVFGLFPGIAALVLAVPLLRRKKGLFALLVFCASSVSSCSAPAPGKIGPGLYQVLVATAGGAAETASFYVRVTP
jgi:hypothetical protein